MDYPKAQIPEDIPRLFTEAWMKRDAEFLASLFSSDAEFVNVVGLWWHNREQIRKAHDYGLKVIFNNSKVKIQKVTVKELGENHALVHAKMMLTEQTPKTGVDVPSIRQNIFSFVAEKREDHWICVSAHNTDIIPGAETNIVDEEGKMKSISYRK